MMITLCTLFNTNYIDKGLTMYESIERHTQDFVLYVLCMDDRCFDILSDLKLPRFIPIRLSDFESPELLKVKAERSMGEYCWTCASSLVDYIFNTYNPDYCAYIDSDLYFYDDVNVVIKEMQQRNASVMITGHRFNWYERKEQEWKVGKYCVEFNTFKNDNNGRRLLSIWKEQCLDYCRCDNDGIHFGDQKYLDNWCDDYSFCIETNNLGAGIAPWNINQYHLVEKDENGPVKVKCKGSLYNAFFYHFHNLQYIESDTVATNTMKRWGVELNFMKTIYLPYLNHIKNNKKKLYDNYSVQVLLKSHPGYVSNNNLPFFSKILDYINKYLSIKGIKLLLFCVLPSKLFSKHDIIRL